MNHRRAGKARAGGAAGAGHLIGISHDIRAAGTAAAVADAVVVVTNTRPKSYKSPPAVRAKSAQVAQARMQGDEAVVGRSRSRRSWMEGRSGAGLSAKDQNASQARVGVCLCGKSQQDGSR